MIAAPNAPDAALLQWAKSIPAVHCVAPAFRPWIHANDDRNLTPITPVGFDRFDRVKVAVRFDGMTRVGRDQFGDEYRVARMPPRAIVLNSGSGEMEDSFYAVIADAPSPPRAVASLAAAPRANALSLGSTRADVEHALGPGHTKTLCGFDVVRYEPRPQRISEFELWFFYRLGRVVAIAEYEAV